MVLNCKINIVAIALILLALPAAAGCGSQDYEDRIDESIVNAEPSVSNPVENSSFEDGDLTSWTTLIPDGSTVAVTDSIARRGTYSLQVNMNNWSPTDVVSILQTVDSRLLARNSTLLRMTAWVRGRALSKRVPSALRLTSVDESFVFISGITEQGQRVGIPRGNSGWTKLEIEANVRDDLSTVTVFPVDSPANVEGVFWIDDVRLTSTGGTSPE